MPVVLRYLVFWPLDQWQVDVEVYREAGVSILTGRPVYAALTEAPQLLPFTYPPFAAVLAIPLAMMPFGAAGWLWTGLQVLATTAIVWYAGYRLIHRAGAWMPLALALLVAPMLWLHPVSDGIRFGQVNAFMVLACLMDLREPRPGLVRRVPRGVLVGLAMAVKLTPGVFVVHFLVTKRWKEAATAVGTAVAVTLGRVGAAAAGVVRVLGRRAAGPRPARPQHGHVEPVDPRPPAAGRPRRDCRAPCSGWSASPWSGCSGSGWPAGSTWPATRSARSPRSG